jgi:hypothetical protein
MFSIRQVNLEFKTTIPLKKSTFSVYCMDNQIVQGSPKKISPQKEREFKFQILTKGMEVYCHIYHIYHVYFRFMAKGKTPNRSL